MMRDTGEEKERLKQQWEGRDGALLGAKRAWGLEATCLLLIPSTSIPQPQGRAGLPEAEPSLSFHRDPNDPRDPKAPQWPPYTGGAQQYVSLNLRPLEVRQGLRAQACAFWNGFLPKLLSATGTQGPAGRGWAEGVEMGRGERERGLEAGGV